MREAGLKRPGVPLLTVVSSVLGWSSGSSVKVPSRGLHPLKLKIRDKVRPSETEAVKQS